MEAKVVKKGTEQGGWHDTAIFFETRTKTGLEVMCMFERAGNFMLTVNKHTTRDNGRVQKKNTQEPMNMPATAEFFDTNLYYIRVDRLVVGDMVQREEQLYQGKPKISREEFARHYNYIRMQIINETVYLNP